MSEVQPSWWLDADRTWRRGAPPDEWWQGSDGRWHAPDEESEQTTEELVVVPAPWTDPPPLPTEPVSIVPARHLTARHDEDTARHRRARSADTVPDTPPWIKVAVAALVAVFVVSAAGVLIAASKGTDGGSTPSPDERSAPAEAGSPSAGDATSSTKASEPEADQTPSAPAAEQAEEPDPTDTTTTPSTTATTATTAPPPADGDPLAACSTGQRKVIERGDHPWEWYVARFDDDGDGVLCN